MSKRLGYFTNINEATKKPTNEIRYQHLTSKGLGTVVFLAKSKKQAEKLCMSFNKVLRKEGGGIQKIFPKKVTHKQFCKKCKADLTQPNTVCREYVNKDGGTSRFGEGHYDNKGNYEPDNSPRLSDGRYDLKDDSDTCVDCYTQL